MSAAIRATTARERANIAAAFIRRGSTDSRSFSDCFEMSDGDEVRAILCQKATTDTRIAAYARKAKWITDAPPETDADLLVRVADALATGERGDNLVALAREAHVAQMMIGKLTETAEQLAAIVNTQEQGLRRAENLLLGLHKVVGDLGPYFDKPITEESMPRWLALDSAQKAVAQYFAATPNRATR